MRVVTVAYTLFSILAATIQAQAQVDPVDPVDRPCDPINMKNVSVPHDFLIVKHSGPRHVSHGAHNSIAIDATGKITETEFLKRPRKITMLGKKVVKHVSRNDVKILYATVIACDFVKMSEENRSYNFHTSTKIYYTVTAGGRTHTVNEFHSDLIRWNTIDSAFDEVISKEKK
jgi:hypothetical protein